MAEDRYLEPHQARQRAGTLFEDLLGDSIERAFGVTIHSHATEEGEAYTLYPA